MNKKGRSIVSSLNPKGIQITKSSLRIWSCYVRLISGPAQYNHSNVTVITTMHSGPVLYQGERSTNHSWATTTPFLVLVLPESLLSSSGDSQSSPTFFPLAFFLLFLSLHSSPIETVPSESVFSFPEKRLPEASPSLKLSFFHSFIYPSFPSSASSPLLRLPCT